MFDRLVFGIYRTPNTCETDAVSADEAEELLAQTLVGLHIHTLHNGAEGRRQDLVLDLAGRHLRLEVKYYSLVDRSRAFQVLDDLDRGGHPRGAEGVPVVVSDRIVEVARDRFREAGVSWFDLRGHLYLNGPGLLIDVATHSGPKHAASPKAIAGRVGLATSIDILLTRPDKAVVRETARRIGAAPRDRKSVV